MADIKIVDTFQVNESRTETAINDYLKNCLKSLSKQDRKKVLVLGSRNSGISSFLTQLKVNFGREDIMSESHSVYRERILRSCLDSMLHLLLFVDHPYLGLPLPKELEVIRNKIEEVKSIEEMDTNFCKNMHTLWKSDQIQFSYANCLAYTNNHIEKYFLDNIMLYSDPNYRFVLNDILRYSPPPSGVEEIPLNIDDTLFSFLDASNNIGNCNSYQKFLSYFYDVHCIIFIADISAYDSAFLGMNRLKLSIKYFSDIINHPSFRDKTVILFLNKRDLFLKKIINIPLFPFFNEFDGSPDDYEAGLQFIQQQFERENRRANRNSNPIFIYITSFTEAESIKATMISVKELIEATPLS